MKSTQKTAGEQLIAHYQPKSPVSEKFRGIRSNIMFSNADETIKSVVITSALPEAGKSTISANLAVTYAQAGYRTLILDGDMRKPTQHYIFKVQNQKGLSSLLVNQSTFAQSIQNTNVDNLDILTSGPVPPNPSELISTKTFNNIYASLLESYDFIVVDTPPVNSVTDAQVYTKIVGQCILVVNSEHKQRSEIIKGKKELDKVGAKVLGVVLNKVKPDKNSSYYAYYGDQEND